MAADLIAINDGDTLAEWRQKINDTILCVNNLSVGGVNMEEWAYSGSFTDTDFVDSMGYCQLRILPSVHGLGSHVTLKSILRQEDNRLSNALVSWKVYVDGTIVVMTEEKFSGKYIISREV